MVPSNIKATLIVSGNPLNLKNGMIIQFDRFLAHLRWKVRVGPQWVLKVYKCWNREKKISKNLLKDHFKQEKLKVLLKHPQFKIKVVQIIILGVRSQCELNFYIERNSLNIFFSKTIWSEKLNTVLKNLSLV